MSIETKHSPGPWHACVGRGDYGGLCQCGLIWSKAADIVVATVMRKDDDHEKTPELFAANARLIASAPDLAAEVTRLRSINEVLTRALGRIAGPKPCTCSWCPSSIAAQALEQATSVATVKEPGT